MLVKEPDHIATASGGEDKGRGLTFGDNGVAETDKYTFVSQDKEKSEPTGSIIDKLTGKNKVVPYKIITIQDKLSGENKAFEYPNPKKEGYKLILVPKEYEQKPDGKWVLVASPKEGGKDVEIPEEKVTSDMVGITGASLKDLLRGNKKNEVEKTSAENEKITVEKDGKKFKLPKSQQEQALKQGYKLSN